MVADHLADAVSIVDIATTVTKTVPVGHAPYDVELSVDGDSAWVSNQGADTVSTVDLRGPVPAVARATQVGTHPGALLRSHDGRSVFVANGDSDQLSVIDAATGKVTRTIELAPYHGAKAGSAPFDVAESPDGKRLFVSFAGNKAVAVIDAGSGRRTGLIPTGWYPTALAVAGDHLYVLNAKGLGAGPNNGPGHPDPTSPDPVAEDQYSGSMIQGTLSTVSLSPGDTRMADYTSRVRAGEGFDRPQTDRWAPAIKHVIYVVQENRTYDQVFGSIGKGNGDASLNLFGDESAPNQRELQRRFVTLDNFYANAEVSAQGWNWSVAANSNPYAEALWPAHYSGRKGTYPSESSDPAVVPNKSRAEGYIWQRLEQKNVSFRNYGFYVNADAQNKMVGTDAVLDAHTDHEYRGFDMACPDNPDTFTPRSAVCGTPRYTEWKKEFDGYVRHGDLPTVEFLRLPNDHTSGTKASLPTPRAYVADNDLALGRIVDAVSHSKYWKDTAIFVTEDDAQNGPDHVDAHRTISQVISPYTQSGRVDSTLYSTASMLRTIENIVGVQPLSQFDTFATPMVKAFSTRRSLRMFDAIRPSEAGENSNAKDAPLAAISARQSLGKEDQINERDFNMAIWKSVKGRHSSMPEPQHRMLPPGGDADDGE